MQFDVRIVSAPNFELQTSLTRDVQSEVDLRLRGTPRQPMLLGSISVDSGQVQVFGNQYNIDRGDIRFTNPIRIEPVFDLSLETKVSGVSVNITLTGTMDKLKTNYSSDPPLEPSKIIALLAVGRDPDPILRYALRRRRPADSSDFVRSRRRPGQPGSLGPAQQQAAALPGRQPREDRPHHDRRRQHASGAPDV